MRAANHDQSRISSVERGNACVALRFGFVRLDGAAAAASRFADACDRFGGVPRLREVGVVERHRDGHLVLRGSFAGRYVDADESDQVCEPGTRPGALIGGILGPLLGPPGIAVRLVLGKPTETGTEPEPEPLANRLRDALAPDTSALVIVAGPQEVGEMLESVGSGAAEVTQRALSADAPVAVNAEIGAAAPVLAAPA